MHFDIVGFAFRKSKRPDIVRTLIVRTVKRLELYNRYLRTNGTPSNEVKWIKQTFLSVRHIIMSNILSIGGVFDDAHWIESADAIKVAFVFAGFSLLLSTIHIVRHLKNYTMPQVQLYVIRILLTCPVYAITSSVAIVLRRNGIYAEVVRDVYEAVVIYSFMNLILEYCGGETDCVYMMENEPRLRLPCPLCCMKPRARTMKYVYYYPLSYVNILYYLYCS